MIRLSCRQLAVVGGLGDAYDVHLADWLSGGDIDIVGACLHLVGGVTGRRRYANVMWAPETRSVSREVNFRM